MATAAIDRTRPAPFLRHVTIKNYKSIAKCDVELGAFTILVGRNGAGKSNFLDALKFASDAVAFSPDHAMKLRGGLESVRRRSTGHPHNFAIELAFDLPNWNRGVYGFEIAARPKGSHAISFERLSVSNRENQSLFDFERTDKDFKISDSLTYPPLSADRLFLPNLGTLPLIRPLYDAVTTMGFYRLSPEAMRGLQNPDAGELLHADGGNLASVISRLESDDMAASTRVRMFLRTIVPDVVAVNRISLGPKETLEFKQRVKGSHHPWKFYAASMSDGTLRAFGTLVAVAQLAKPGRPVSFVGIEEPETALHPAASRALVDALGEASQHTQVAATTHSPDLLDNLDINLDVILVVINEEGVTRLAPLDKASQRAVNEHLYTFGELQRIDQLSPDAADLERQNQLQLFGE